MKMSAFFVFFFLLLLNVSNASSLHLHSCILDREVGIAFSCTNVLTNRDNNREERKTKDLNKHEYSKSTPISWNA